MNSTRQTKGFLILAVAILLAVIAYAALIVPDRRTGAEKVGDAISELPNGLDKAARQLENRTPGEKLGDQISDFGEEVKEQTDN